MCLERVPGRAGTPLLRPARVRAGFRGPARSRPGWLFGALCLVATAVLVPASLHAGPASEPPLLKRVRLAAHADYDRLVFDLDRPAELIRAGFIAGGDLEIELRARLPGTGLDYDAALVRVRGLVTESIPGGTRLRLAAANSRVRVFRLREPERLVVDFADPGTSAFAVPAGAEAVALALQPLAAKPPGPSATESLSEPANRPEPPAAESAAAELSPADTGVLAAPVAAAAARLPRAQRPEAARPSPLPVQANRGLVLAAWIALGLGLLAAAAFWVRARSASHAGAKEARLRGSDLPRAPESITPAEIRAAGDRIDALERRIDQELRARQRVEAGLGEVQERLKVLGDRVRRSRLSPPRRSLVPDARDLIAGASPNAPRGDE